MRLRLKQSEEKKEMDRIVIVIGRERGKVRGRWRGRGRWIRRGEKRK